MQHARHAMQAVLSRSWACILPASVELQPIDTLPDYFGRAYRHVEHGRHHARQALSGPNALSTVADGFDNEWYRLSTIPFETRDTAYTWLQTVVTNAERVSERGLCVLQDQTSTTVELKRTAAETTPRFICLSLTTGKPFGTFGDRSNSIS